MRRRSRQRGAAAVELALVLPFLSLLCAAVLDFGRAYHATQQTQHMATEAARRAAEVAVAADVSEHGLLREVMQILGTLLRCEAVSRDASRRTVTVTVRCECPMLTPVLGHGGPLVITRSATAPVPPAPGD